MLTLAQEIKQFIIKPTLERAGWSTPSDLILVYGSGYAETTYQHIMQIGTPQNGGVGFFQDEPSDYKDLYNWLISGVEAGIARRIMIACGLSYLPLDINVLASNIAYAALICRAHYLRAPEPVPAANDASGMSNYHKTHYNSSLGKADIDKNTLMWQKIINGEL